MATDLITTADAARLLKRSQRWVQALVLDGRIESIEIGGIYLMRRSAVEKFQHQPPGRPPKKRPVKKRADFVRNGKKRRK